MRRPFQQRMINNKDEGLNYDETASSSSTVVVVEVGTSNDNSRKKKKRIKRSSVASASALSSSLLLLLLIFVIMVVVVIVLIIPILRSDNNKLMIRHHTIYSSDNTSNNNNDKKQQQQQPATTTKTSLCPKEDVVESFESCDVNVFKGITCNYNCINIPIYDYNNNNNIKCTSSIKCQPTRYCTCENTRGGEWFCKSGKIQQFNECKLLNPLSYESCNNC